MRQAFPALLAISAATLAACTEAATPDQTPDSEIAIAVEREVRRLGSETVVWPGFDPLTIPLAVYDGEHTYLFRHPSPPDGYLPLSEGQPDVLLTGGRDPAVTSNSSADLGGISTATLLADHIGSGSTPTTLAATALHEAFHVFQRSSHPGWAGNEADVFLYPTTDARLLALRRLESGALRRSVEATDTEGAACWTRLALAYRSDRFAAMDPAFSTYDRLTELNEGLATYVQRRATGQAAPEIPEAEFAATEFRGRAYVIGPVLAFLLDRFDPGWQSALESDDEQYLDELLEAASGGNEPGAGAPCAFEDSEIAQVQRAADGDAAAAIAAQAAHRAAFDATAGWRVVVFAAAGQPLWPQGFDPLNVERVEGGFLHTRFVELGNDAGQLRVIDEAGADVAALTVGAGDHPLFDGVGTVTIAGLSEPEIATEDGATTILSPGFEARFGVASVVRSGTEVLVRLQVPQ